MSLISGFREWVNRNSGVATVGAAVICVVALVVVFTQATGSSQRVETTGRQAYYYDVETEEVFTAPADKTPPIQSPDGNQAVRAHMFSCGGCSEADRFVGYYEKYTDEARQLKNDPEAAATEENHMKIEQGHMVSADGENWRQWTASDQIRQSLGEQRCESRADLAGCQP